MASYVSFGDLFSTVTNATCIRDNTKNDDSTDTIAFSDFDFYYNSTKVTKFYVNGNGWIGIGTSNEYNALRVNRTDMAVYYVYKESATVSGKKVFRIKWKGVSQYSQSYSDTSNYALIYDVAFVETGDIVLNISKKPTTSLQSGTSYNGLWKNYSQIASFTLNGTAPIIKTFTPSDPSTGTAFTVSDTYPSYSAQYYLIRSQSKLYTISNNALTQVSQTLSASTFSSYGMRTLPSYSLYSSLTNPEILIYDDIDISNIDTDITYKSAASLNPTYSEKAIITTKSNFCMQDTFKYSSYSAFSQNFKKIFVSGSGDLKILFVTTQSYTYDSHTYSPNSYSFKDGNWIITNDLEHDGMSTTTFNAIPKSKWLEIFPNEFYLKIYIPSQNSYFENVVVIYNGLARYENATALKEAISSFNTQQKLPIKISACFENVSIGSNFIYAFDSFTSLKSVFYDLSKPWEIVTNTSAACIFRACYNLTSFPNQVGGTSLSSTFSHCYNLVNAPVILNGVTDMVDSFSTCNNLANAPVIPNSVTNLTGAFANCSNLVNAPAIPNSVTVIGNGFDGAFEGCTNLVNAPILPNSITNMSRAFYRCTNLKNVPTIPNAVVNLFMAFEDCHNLTTIPNLPNTVKDVSWTFGRCYNMTTAPTLPDSITKCEGTFSFCYTIDKRVIPNSANITNLRDWWAGWNTLTSPPAIPSQVTNLAGAFRGCGNLTSIPTLPSGVTNLASAFEYCRKATTTPTIPSGVTDLYYAFKDTNITAMPTIPSGVVNMQSTFERCNNMVTLTNIPETVNNIDGFIASCNKAQGDIYVHGNNCKITWTTFSIRASNAPMVNIYAHSGTNTYKNIYKAMGNTTTNTGANITLKTF